MLALKLRDEKSKGFKINSQLTKSSQGSKFSSLAIYKFPQ